MAKTYVKSLSFTLQISLMRVYLLMRFMISVYSENTKNLIAILAGLFGLHSFAGIVDLNRMGWPAQRRYLS